MILSTTVLLTILSAASSTLVSAAPNRTKEEKRDGSVNVGFPYGQEKVRGVNLGGWLLLEPFITPWMFENLDESIVDEFTFCQNQDRGTAEAALRAHWDSFITEDDFRQIAAAGLNHVRLPFGFWAFQQSGPYIQGARDYIYRATGWARNHGLHILLDLHGAENSQNGFDNSGERGSARWAYDSGGVYRTKELVQQLSQEFSDPSYYGVVTGLAILNEPAGFTSDEFLRVTRQFTIDSYYAARYPWAPSGSASQSGLLIVYHDAFQPSTYWYGAFNYPQAADVALDTHIYQVFSVAELQRTWSEHLANACFQGNNLRASPNWGYVGEFSLAVYDCARWLNGRGVGARYDGSYPGSYYQGSCGSWNTGDGSGFSQEYKNFLRDYYDTQIQTWEANSEGYFFWTWKAAPAEWSYQAGLRLGFIPSNPQQHNGYKCS